MKLLEGMLALGCSIVAAGCALGTPQPSQDTNAQMAQGCTAQMDNFLGTYCTDQTVADLGAAQASAPIAQQAAALKSQCSAYAPQDRVAKVDTCITKIQGAAIAENDAQKARLPEAKKKEPAVRADPEYATLLDRFKRVDDEYLIAFDNAQVAKKNGNPNLSRYQLRAEDAQKERTKAEANLMSLFKKYGIEPSDAKLIGLW